MKRVMFYSHYGEMGGAEISLLLMASHLAGFEPMLVAPKGTLLQRAKSQGLATAIVSAHVARFSRNPLVVARGAYATWRMGGELRRVIARYRPDIVHANSVRAGLVSAFAVEGTSLPIVWHVRDQLPKNTVGRIIRKIAERHADIIIAVSEAIRQNFATTPRLSTKTTVVPNGIEIDEPTADGLRRVLGLPERAFVVGVVGQIAIWKRQMDVVKAFSHIAPVIPDAHLLVVGAPRFRPENYAYEQELRLAVERLGLGDRVSFLGHREDIPRVMATLDVLVVPSNGEPFGRVVLEAMLAGRPVIGTNAGGIPDIIGRDESAGLLVDIGDTDAIAQNLVRLAQDPILARALGKRGQQRVRELFDIGSVCVVIGRIYSQLVDKNTIQAPSAPSALYVGGSASSHGAQRPTGSGS